MHEDKRRNGISRDVKKTRRQKKRRKEETGCGIEEKNRRNSHKGDKKYRKTDSRAGKRNDEDERRK